MTTPLLEMLQETVNDETIFDMSGVEDGERQEFRQELRKAWAHVYDNAAVCWTSMFHSWGVEHPELVGPEMCRCYEPLSSCWLDSFREAIVKTAKREDLPQKDDREFLWCMLGILEMSWQCYLGLRHGRIDGALY